jgi:hypothetical protein
MKKIKSLLLGIGVMIFLSTSLSAQFYDNAIGGRFGTDFMLTYKQFFMHDPDPQLAFEVMAGLQLDERILNRRANVLQTNGYVAQGMCYYHRDIGFDTGFSFFAGLGIFMGVYTPQGQKLQFGGGVAAGIGASYTFTHIPLDISIDWMPILGKPRMSLARAGLTLRYVIPTHWH